MAADVAGALLTRKDEPANRLMMVLPDIPRWGLRLVSGPMLSKWPSCFGLAVSR
jgi:hypothetical protein